MQKPKTGRGVTVEISADTELLRRAIGAETDHLGMVAKRAAFEEWCGTVLLDTKRLYGGYWNESTAFAWLAWQAALTWRT
jgi:hypothetical protein